MSGRHISELSGAGHPNSPSPRCTRAIYEFAESESTGFVTLCFEKGPKHRWTLPHAWISLPEHLRDRQFVGKNLASITDNMGPGEVVDA